MKKIAGLVSAAVIVSLSVGFARVDDDDDDKKPKYTVKQVMGKVFKGPTALKVKITKGTATDEEKKMAVEYLEALALNQPKKGDMESWKTKTMALVKAAKEVAEGNEEGIKAFEKAANCKACHDTHK